MGKLPSMNYTYYTYMFSAVIVVSNALLRYSKKVNLTENDNSTL